ncbi:galaxin-like [Ruditapes philippinarum]|uniref:galaxin-like n=1 Tax=Ruditapes philippinarum TaxID=129788 RepID=UPI00295A968D|nr:galaxin-like [Ruditapes philippinarum]
MYKRRMLLFLQILVTFAVLKNIHCNGTLCNGNWADNDEVCCGGEIYQKFQNSKEMACCTRSGKTELYPMGEKICCGEQLIPVQPNQSLACCNKELIDINIYSCCGNKDFGRKYKSGKCCVDWDNKTVGIHEGLKGRKKCCSTEVYNKDTERCIYGPLNKHKIIVRKTSMRKCGTKQFNSDTSLCCEQNEMVIPKPPVKSGGKQPYWICWNDKAYDANLYYLDEKTSRVILIGLASCDNVEYNPSAQMCCGNKLFPRNPGKNSTCCGNGIWDLDDTSETCCNGTFIPTSNHGCCNEVPFKKGHDVECCARELYDKTSHLCCKSQSSYMTVQPKLSADHTACCKSPETNQMKTFNNYTEECVNGQVREKVSNNVVTPRQISEINPPKKPARCEFCRNRLDAAHCKKANVYEFFVYDQRESENGTIFNAIILQPFRRSGKILTGEKIKIRTRNQCECFKPKRSFYLFTNRKIKSLKQNRYNIRFTSSDVFIRKTEHSLVVKCLTQHHLGTNKSRRRHS